MERQFSLKNVALAALVASAIAFVVWHGLGALMHSTMGRLMHGPMMSGPMMSGSMMSGSMMSGSMMSGGMMSGGMMTGQSPQGTNVHGAMPGQAGHKGAGMGPMGTKLTGDADRDFAAEMIPHHQMAVDMANEVLKSGKDPELKKLAKDVIKAQQSEIEFLKTWLAKRGN